MFHENSALALALFSPKYYCFTFTVTLYAYCVVSNDVFFHVCNCTTDHLLQIFEDVGHSCLARELMMNYLVVKRPEPVGIAVLSSVRDSLQQSALLHKNLIRRWQLTYTAAEANSEDCRPPSLLLMCNDCKEQINPVTAPISHVCRFV